METGRKGRTAECFGFAQYEWQKAYFCHNSNSINLMGSTKIFKNVTPSTWKCVKESSTKEHGTIFSPPDASTGTATTVVKTLGMTFTVALSFNYDQVKEQVTYIINERPKLVVSENDIWDGIKRTIDGCKK